MLVVHKPTKPENKKKKPKPKQAGKPAKIPIRPTSAPPGNKARPNAIPGVRSAQEVAAAITNPYACAARYGGDFSRVPTALARPHHIMTATNTTASLYEICAFDGSIVHAISRDPLQSHVYTVANPEAISYEYHSVYRTRNASTGLAEFRNSLLATSDVIRGPTDLAPEYFQPVGAGSSYFRGEKVFTVESPDDSYKWVWLDARNVEVATRVNTKDTQLGLVFVNSTMSAKVAVAGGVIANGAIFRYGCESPVYQFECNTTFAGWTNMNGVASNQWYVNRSGYYRISINPTPLYTTLAVLSTDCYIAFGVASALPATRVDPVPDLTRRAADMTGVRILGASIMFSATANAQAAGGTVYGAYMGNNASIGDLFSYDPAFTQTARTLYDDTTATQPYQKGMYAWHNVTSSEDFRMVCPFVNDGNTSNPIGMANYNGNNVCGFRAKMFPAGGWTVLCFKPEVTETAAMYHAFPVYSGSTVRVTTAFALEFTTRSSWYDTVPPSPTDVDGAVRLLLARMPNFYENPLHVRDIGNWIKRNWRAMAKAGLAAVGLYNPSLLPATQGISSVL